MVITQHQRIVRAELIIEPRADHPKALRGGEGAVVGDLLQRAVEREGIDKGVFVDLAALEV